VHPVALLSFFIPSVFMFFCLISLHYVNGINSDDDVDDDDDHVRLAYYKADKTQLIQQKVK